MPDLVHEVDNSSDKEGDDDSMATPYLSSDTQLIEESEGENSDNDMPALIPPDDQSSSSDDDSMYESRRATRTKLSRSKRAERRKQNELVSKRTPKARKRPRART